MNVAAARSGGSTLTQTVQGRRMIIGVADPVKSSLVALKICHEVVRYGCRRSSFWLLRHGSRTAGPLP